MKISEKTLLKKERGDLVAISKQSKISRPTITLAFKLKYGTRKTVLAIESYYKSLKLAK
ncbi:MAG: hypothetical protein V4538_15510 [Bacteroidota bacterium]